MKNNTLAKVSILEARAEAPASFVVCPSPVPENGLKKWSAFTIGVMAGAIGVTVAHSLVEELGQSGLHLYHPQNPTNP